MEKKLIVYSDGSSRGNPGPAAIGVVITDAGGEVVYEAGTAIGHATNNMAEYHALIHGLEQAAQLGADVVEVRLDSELLVRQMTGEYRIKNRNLLPLAVRARTLIKAFARCEVRYISRKENARADRLADQALIEATMIALEDCDG